jgi:16S rRNA (cytosine967-C5)-methyltransferase
MSEAEALDCPDWLIAPLEASLGTDFAPVMEVLRHRAPVFLRVNLARADVATALAALAADGIAAAPHPLSPTALEVTDGARRVAQGRAYQAGLVELQDAASQAVVDLIGVTAGMRVLDYCAGGGGKSLALAAAGAVVSAHDSAPRRMADLPARAERAGVRIEVLAPGAVAGIARGSHDLVLVDAPCSGSGAWRRTPQGKWDLTPERLDELCHIQAGILDEITPLVAVGGGLAYVTCSLLSAENHAQVSAFHSRHKGWKTIAQRQFTPLDGGDGFFVAHLTRFD